MKIPSIFAAASLALGLGLSAAFAQDSPGVKEFGVDISGAGSSKEDNQKFVHALSADQQAKVKEVCLIAVTEPEGTHPPAVITFCRNVNPPA